MQIPDNVEILCLQGIRALIDARRVLLHQVGAVACLAVMVMTVACTGGGEPSAPGATVLEGETLGPALTLVPPPTQTPLPTIASTPTPTPMLSVTAGSAQEMTAVQIHERLSPSVTYIETPTGKGSGFLIEGGYIVTNHHVVWPWEEARVVFPDGPEYVAAVAVWDPMSDITLLGPIEANVQPLELGNGEYLPIGSEVFLLGYPGESDPSPTPTMLSGLLSHYRQWDRLGMTYLQTDASVADGQIGGVLVNATGEVIGIVGFSFTEANYALAASAADMELILQQLILGRDPSGVSNRSFRGEQPAYRFQGDLQNTWDSRMFLMDLATGDSVEIEIDCAEPVRFNLTDTLGNTLLDVDISFGGMEQGSAEVLTDGHQFLTVETPAHSSSCFDLSANVPMVPYTDLDDGRRLNLDETIAGSIDYPGDRDWYSVHLEEGDLLRIYTDSFNVDTVLHVDFLNSRVNQVVRDDDSGGGMFETDSELVYRALVTGEHFVVVEGYDDWSLGGYFLSVDRAPPGTDAATVPPAREEVDSPFGTMIVFESQLSDFSVQVPAGWVEQYPDENDPSFTLLAVDSEAEGSEIGVVGIMEFDLQASGERQTLEEFVDSVAEEAFGDGIETRRENVVTVSGDRGIVLEFQTEIPPGEFSAARMLISILDERFPFVVFYVFSQEESQSQTALTEYSFSTLDSSRDAEEEPTATPVSESLLANLAKQTEKGLVGITAYKPGVNRFTSGIGFIFATDGSTAFVVTYSPLIEFEGETANPIEVRVNRANTYRATLLGYDSDGYFGVMSICCNDNFAALELETSGSPRIGTQVIAVGCPEYINRAALGSEVRSCSTAIAGVIQSTDPDWLGESSRLGMFTHDARLYSDYFGGPLFSTEGKVWGINVGLTGPEGNFYTVPYWTINELLSSQTGKDPAPTFTGTTDYDADNDGLIEISNLEQLDSMRYDLDGDGVTTDPEYATAFPDALAGMGCPSFGCTGYELTANLDFDTNGNGLADDGDSYWNDGAGWVPLGDRDRKFTANFDGNGNTIANLYIDRYITDAGLFGSADYQSKIWHIGLTAVAVSNTSDKNVGSTGSLVGLNQGEVRASHATGSVLGSANVGGLVGTNVGIVDASYADVNVTGEGLNNYYTGGLAGQNAPDAVIALSYAAGRVTAQGDQTGGLVGGSNGGSEIVASYATGIVSGGSSDTGGLVGNSWYTTIVNSYAAGRVSSTIGQGGGLVGEKTGGEVRDSYWNVQTSGKADSAGGEGKTTRELQSPTSNTGLYANWEADRWDFGTSRQFPALIYPGMSLSAQRR